ncbi:helix-turn-helix domain-containing protein [Bordetella petrii]|uniref:helix-turn-helix domain-containing protein n=1 Tax=Bordetella petrii TaxID=94624 RepID=UPI001A96DDD6|nr:AraC family transcriptional regulator [Bordetella petrii]MBO1114620.1 helix-turn-helix transcriptional regulator [Bordetella petrii]
MSKIASAPSDFTLFHTLREARVHLDRAASLGAGLAVAQWNRDQRAGRALMDYDTPGHHTLSLYLRGGETCFRLSQRDLHGGAGKFCVLPDQHHSRWSMNEEVRFLHLYIAPQRLAREAVMRLDREPRELELRDRTYIQDPSLAGACRALLAADWNVPAARLAASSAAEAVLHHLLAHGTGRPAGRLTPLGGLAPAVRRRVRDYIDAHLAEPLTLDVLAGVAALSTYHFARMFHASFGEPPHAWVLGRRLARARALLGSTADDLASVAQACGFGNASHLSRAFAQAAGATPGQYRAAMRAAPQGPAHKARQPPGGSTMGC